MNFEEQLTNKKYYEHFVNEHKANHPVQVLGDLYYEEQKKEAFDLSYIRFAQGELYFHFKDFESAIYKWENIHNELEAWAKKNMADAYVELGLYANAEDLYTAIKTDSLVLNTEIGLQLFSLYINLGKRDKADDTIKWVVAHNPDYPSVTNIAIEFFEENQDWKSAVELSIQEGKRKGSIQWFSVLKSYVDEGRTQNYSPEYFEEPLISLKQVSQSHFEQLLSSLWKSYETNDRYLSWVKSLNSLFSKLEQQNDDNWNETQRLFLEVFFSLINGKYLLKEIESVLPKLLNNWAKVSDSANAALANGAILAWNDYFPMTLESTMVEKAEAFISREPISLNTFDQSLQLLSDILAWGKEEAIDVTSFIKGKSLDNENSADIETFLEGVQENERNEKLLELIRNVLNTLLDQMEEQKTQLKESIQWKEETLSKLNGAVHQLDDFQYGKSKVIKNAFLTRKEELKETIQANIPEILRGCVELVKEDSDVRKLPVVINDEMNLRVQLYLQESIMPLFQTKFQEWLKKAESDFNESQFFVEELTAGINQLFREEKLVVACDFEVLNDWKRDLERMTGFVSYENENIFLRFTPSQFLLKSAGKLLGALPQNKGFLASQYKKLIENEDFSEMAETITRKFLQQLELFERTLERDIAMFFQNPLHVFKQAVEHLEKEKKQHETELQELKSNPEKFYDPIILFQIRHRQLEWLNIASMGNLILNKDQGL